MNMQRQHPKPEMQIPITWAIYQQLMSASLDTGYKQEFWEIAATAIHEWMVRNAPQTIARNAVSGYQWKQIFLPSGTLLRTVYNGANFHALVEGDRLRYDGMDISPSGFVNTTGGVRRNAWKVIWILFPDNPMWRLAASLRPRRTRLDTGKERRALDERN
jgi:hypothetical protein